MEEMICVMCNEMRFESYGQETSIGFVCFEDECVNESRLKIDRLVRTLKSRLREAEEILTLIAHEDMQILENGYQAEEMATKWLDKNPGGDLKLHFPNRFTKHKSKR